jgi:hypothetical protein
MFHHALMRGLEGGEGWSRGGTAGGGVLLRCRGGGGRWKGMALTRGAGRSLTARGWRGKTRLEEGEQAGRAGPRPWAGRRERGKGSGWKRKGGEKVYITSSPMEVGLHNPQPMKRSISTPELCKTGQITPDCSFEKSLKITEKS